MTRQHTILVVDDEDFVRHSLSDLLESEGYLVEAAASAAEALKTLTRRVVDVVVADLSMPGGSGIALLEDVRDRGLTTPVVLLTGVGKVSDAVAAMKAGAYDFVLKPVDPNQFVHLVARAIEHHDLLDEVAYLRHAVRRLRGSAELVGVSAELQRLRALIQQVAPTDATVLISGESGTGKELVAAEIHRMSGRAERELVRVNCSAVSESLFESEFFGHRRGAFTGAVEDRTGRFAEAEGGTLVLDEISTLDASLQAKLLRVLESGEYTVVGESRARFADVRVIAISNDDMPALVREGGFRSDLYFRLNVFPIEVAPLRERREDIPILADYFLRRFSSRAEASEPLADDAVQALVSYGWPGNIRELRNVIERAVILSGPATPNAATFTGVLDSATAAMSRADLGDLNIRRRTVELERQLILGAMSRAADKKEAAALLGVDPRNLAYHLRKHGLTSSDAEE